MKILQCITRGDTFYGAQSHFLDLCKLLAGRGHNVLALMGCEGELSERLANCGVKTVFAPSLIRDIDIVKDLKAVWQLRNVIREFSPDLVACHSSKAGILGRLAAQLENTTNVFTAHGWSFEENVPLVPRNIYLALERRLAKKTSRFIAVAEDGKQIAVKNRICDPDRISVIHYGVSDLRVNFVREPSDVFTLTMVAGFRRQKDHSTLIKALAGLKDRNWKLNLLGDGELMGEIRNLVESHGLEERVRFQGAVRDVLPTLGQTDVMVLTTHWEGLPISIIEGCSVGLPTIASDVSGVREEVINDFNGILVGHEDVQAVRGAITSLMDSPAKRLDFGINARKVYEERFQPEVMLRKTLAAYEQALATHGRVSSENRQAVA